MFKFISRIFQNSISETQEDKNTTMKYLIVGLGNIGSEYVGTRHNIGFRILEELALSIGANFEDKRYGYISNCRIKNAELCLLKPSTYMNLSGNAVRYWLQKEKIPLERMLIICDDISLPLGKLRLRPSGSDGGHNGLKHIGSVLGRQDFNRLRFGVGNSFPRGGQADYVLGKFTEEEETSLKAQIDRSVEAIKCFCLSGITAAMNQYNRS